MIVENELVLVPLTMHDARVFIEFDSLLEMIMGFTWISIILRLALIKLSSCPSGA